MCGILGVLGVEAGAATIKHKVLNQVRRIRHRGPDWGNVYCKGKNILAHQRLSIVDVEHGNQPLFNEEKTIALVANGEIYNYKLLRQKLKNPKSNLTETDSEIILQLYQQEGVNFLNLLNGIFAFCLVDEKKGTYLIARDHIGIIPLYIGWDQDGALWFCSELKGLHDVCVKFEEFLPGHYLSSETGKLERWYNPIFYDEKFIPTTPVNVQTLRASLEAAVTRQLMSDVPYGVLLSGGLDSSVISAIAARNFYKQNDDEKKIKNLHSFSVGLKGSPDLIAAKKVADFIKTTHHEIIFTVDEGLNALVDVIYHLETFDVTTCRAATPMFLMSRKIKSLGIKMVLSGEGSDEVFGGYLYFHKAPNREEFQRETVRKLMALNKFDCLRANKSTSAWGLEVRVPFLDKEFLEYAMTIDPTDKMCGKLAQNRIEKYIVRKAFEGYLPDEVLWRQKEQFSDGVGYGWIGSLKELANERVSDHMLAKASFRFPDNTPLTKEAYFYRSIFEEFYPQRNAVLCIPGGPSIACSTPTAILWDESFAKMADPSGRSVLGVHVQDAQQTQQTQQTKKE